MNIKEIQKLLTERDAKIEVKKDEIILSDSMGLTLSASNNEHKIIDALIKHNRVGKR